MVVQLSLFDLVSCFKINYFKHVLILFSESSVSFIFDLTVIIMKYIINKIFFIFILIPFCVCWLVLQYYKEVTVQNKGTIVKQPQRKKHFKISF